MLNIAAMLGYSRTVLLAVHETSAAAHVGSRRSLSCLCTVPFSLDCGVETRSLQGATSDALQGWRSRLIDAGRHSTLVRPLTDIHDRPGQDELQGQAVHRLSRSDGISLLDSVAISSRRLLGHCAHRPRSMLRDTGTACPINRRGHRVRLVMAGRAPVLILTRLADEYRPCRPQIRTQRGHRRTRSGRTLAG